MVPAPTFAHMACYQSLSTTAAELKYAHSTHLVESISYDEDIRKLRIKRLVSEDDNDELRELLSQEEDRSDAFEKLVNENLARAEDAEARLQAIETDLRVAEQELLTCQAEKNALQHSSEDTAAAVTEKLAAIRELSILKPELEHMKAQAASVETLMGDKLALQRQLSNVQCELENAKRDTQRALAKRRNTGVEIAQEAQVDELRRQLAKEKRARQRAEEAADVTQTDVNVDEVRKELAREKRARQKAEEQLEEAQQATQVEDVRKDLLKEKKAKQKLENQIENLQAELEQERKAAARAAKRADGVVKADNQVEELRQELANEKKERSKAEKAAQKTIEELEAQKSTSDDRLKQFREKFKEMKRMLQQTEGELAAAREVATAAAPKQPASKTLKKRNAAQIDTDATMLGTPGDGPAAKRSRKAAVTVGDKSTFSITPFLNRTVSVAPESGDEQDEGEASPAVKKTKQPLAAQPASKSNVQKKTSAQRKPKAPMLEMVTEEPEDVHSQGQENAAVAKPAKPSTTTLKVKTKTGDEPDKPAAKAKAKLRKSIHEFAAFTAEPEPERKKKRKLGGLGKTLFDEEEESLPVKALPGRALFGGKGFGAFGSKKGGLLGVGKAGSTLMTAADGSGFQFSPLKRSRKNLDDTLRG